MQLSTKAFFYLTSLVDALRFVRQITSTEYKVLEVGVTRSWGISGGLAAFLLPCSSYHTVRAGHIPCSISNEPTTTTWNLIPTTTTTFKLTLPSHLSSLDILSPPF